MPLIEISDRLLGSYNEVHDIRRWLEANVGEYYGRGEDPVIWIGSGWEIRTDRRIIYDDHYISWWVDITDERKFTMFALKWG